MTTSTVVASTSRQTKYATAVYETLQELKHATNGEILDLVLLRYPEVRSTTIHRVTNPKPMMPTGL